MSFKGFPLRHALHGGAAALFGAGKLLGGGFRSAARSFDPDGDHPSTSTSQRSLFTSNRPSMNGRRGASLLRSRSRFRPRRRAPGPLTRTKRRRSRLSGGWKGRRRPSARPLQRLAVLKALIPEVSCRDTTDFSVITGQVRFGPAGAAHPVNSSFGSGAGRCGYHQDMLYDNASLNTLYEYGRQSQTALMPRDTNDAGTDLYFQRKMRIRAYASGRIANTSSGRIRVAMYHVSTVRWHDVQAAWPTSDTPAAISGGGSPLCLAQKLRLATAGSNSTPHNLFEDIYRNDSLFFAHPLYPTFFKVRKVRQWILEHGEARDFKFNPRSVTYDNLSAVESLGGSPTINRGIPRTTQYYVYRIDGQAGLSGEDDLPTTTVTTVNASCAISITKKFLLRVDPYYAGLRTTDLFARAHDHTATSTFINNQYGDAASKFVEALGG